MTSYNPSTGLLDVEETPFRLFQADDAIVTNSLTLQGVVIDPSLQITVADLSGVVSGINGDYVSKSNTDTFQTIKSGLYTEKTLSCFGLASLSTGGGHGFVLTTTSGTTTGRVGSTDVYTITDNLYTHLSPVTLQGLMQTDKGIKFNAGVPTPTTQTLYYDAGVFGIGAGLKFHDLNITELGPRMNTAETNITNNAGNIGVNATAITQMKGTGWTASNTIKGNSDAIATNSSNISTNTSAISTNTSNISTNASNIASNTSSISTNTSNISTNTSNIASNTSNISTNTSNISANATAISNNTTAIATKVSKAGDTMTGDLTIQKTAPRLYIDNTNNTRSGDTYMSMADDGYWQLYSEDQLLLSGRENAINFFATAGAYFNGNLVFSGDNNDVVISKTGTSSKSLRLQAGDDNSSTTDDFSIELTVRDSAASTYTAMKVNGKSQQIEINRDLTVDDTRGIIFEGTTTPSPVTNKLHRRSDGLYWENTNLTAAVSGFWEDTVLSGVVTPDTAYSGVGVGNTQGFYVANTDGIQGVIIAESGTGDGFALRGPDSGGTIEDKMFFNGSSCGFNIGGSNTQFSVGTNFATAKVELFSDLAFVIRDGTFIGTPEVGRLVGDYTNGYYDVTGLQSSGTPLETKFRVGRTSVFFFSPTSHQNDITFTQDDKGIQFKDGVSTKLLTYNTTSNQLEFDGTAVVVGELSLGSGESINFTNNTVPATTSKRLYRTVATGVDNLYFDGKLIPQGYIDSTGARYDFPSVGGSTISYFQSFNPLQNSGFLTRVQAPQGLEFYFNSSGSAVTLRMSHPSASVTRYDYGSANWVAFAVVNSGLVSLGKYTQYSYNDGTTLIDNNQITLQTNGNAILRALPDTSSSFNDGDVVIYQQNRGTSPDYGTACGGLRFYNFYTTATWAIMQNDAYDLLFAYNGTNRSYLQDNGVNESLNFTAFHRSVVEDNIKSKWENYTGLLVETTGEYNNIFYDKNEQNSRYTPAVKEALPCVKLTTKLGSKAVFGVLSHKEQLAYNNTQRTYNTGGYQGHLYELDTKDSVEMNQRYNIASVGECAVWIIKTAGWENPENGDLFMSSDKAQGYGQIQPDGIVKNITAGKLTCSWDNPNLKARQIGDYTAKLMGCVLYCG